MKTSFEKAVKCLLQSVPGIPHLTQKRYLSGGFGTGVLSRGLLSGGLCPRGVCLEGLCPDTMSYLEHRQKIFHSLNKLEISLVKF